jgi:hypothetical protein
MRNPYPPPMSTPFGVSSFDEDIILNMARPLFGARRDQFLADVSAALATAGELGEGRTFRICREIFAKHFDPPLEVERVGKYSRRG